MQARFLPYAETHRFSRLATDYLAGNDSLQGLYAFSPDAAGITQAITSRQKFPVQRALLHQVLCGQYAGLPPEQKLSENIARLTQENTFTICTAHQPNLATGYLYFIYKIVHAIRLAQDLGKEMPGFHFVPVYYMGSEDADLEELGRFRFRERQFVWDAAGQQGAVGRMNTESLAPLLQEFFALIGPPGPHAERLETMLREAYLGQKDIAAATRWLVHALFGKYGLVVLDADDARLKKSFIPVMKEELLQQSARPLVEAANEQLQASGYTPQAFPRDINLFYLRDHLRGRIERQENGWQVHGSNISWGQEALLAELYDHPERFSPNVILRPLYQECILPDIAFIGGGSELAYWMQLKVLFAHHGLFYPTVLLRQSVMWLSEKQQQRMQRLGLSDAAIFLQKDAAFKSWIQEHEPSDWKLDDLRQQRNILLAALREKAASIDSTLERSAASVSARMEHQFLALETKMLRSLKRKHTDALQQIEGILQALFPGGGLAERSENFMTYYLEYGEAFIETLLREMRPLQQQFMILTP
ncbi:MAG: bacillithiol biosynthesis cysteine-adding enzyme BshC [Bacteroidetes bacterium]|nr:bacillithiol biosynthesis cysteine-adding enzyme BshC [Bacteroidota bacterium]